MSLRRVVAPTPEECWAALAAAWGEAASAAVGRDGWFAAALSGGRTPAGFYRLLAAQSLPWERTHLFQVDERLVPPESPESNARLLRESLLDRLPAAPAGVHLVDTGLGDEGTCARAYEERLLEVFVPRREGLPAFDLVLLGIGPDGHTASLFPGGGALDERERLVVGVPREGERLARVTLTLEAINHARAVAFLVTGAGKRAVLERLVAAGESLPPAALVRPRDGSVTLFADAAAAGDLPR